MYLLFDIGGTNTRIAISRNGRDIAENSFHLHPTPPEPKSGIAQFEKKLKTIRGDITSVAGGIAGTLNGERSSVFKSPHLPGWEGKLLKAELERICKAPVTLANDADLGGLAEARRGAGRGKRIVAYITVGTGVGGTRVVDGMIDVNASGFEPGHHILNLTVSDTMTCRCGEKTAEHLEALVSGAVATHRYNEKKIRELLPDIRNNMTRALAAGIYNCITMWSPDIVVLGGGVIKDDALPISKIKTYIDAFTTMLPAPPPIVKGTLGDRATLLGALAVLGDNVRQNGGPRPWRE